MPSSFPRRLALILVVVWFALAVVALPVFAGPATQAPTPTAAPTATLLPETTPLTTGNFGTLGSRQLGYMITWSVTGMKLPAPSYKGYGRHESIGVLTSTSVTVQADLYLALGGTGVTRPMLSANIGSDYRCGADKPLVEWPKASDLDKNGLMGAPFKHEESVTLTWNVKPGEDRVCFDLRSGINGGQFEGVVFSGLAWMAESLFPTATPTPTSTPTTPTPTVTATTVFPPLTLIVPTVPTPKKQVPFPCGEPLYFYPDQDFEGLYTGEPTRPFRARNW